MAKQNTVLIRLVSTAETGFFYVKKKNPKKTTEKLHFRKYDPVARKHVEFKEAKIKELRRAKSLISRRAGLGRGRAPRGAEVLTSQDFNKRG